MKDYIQLIKFLKNYRGLFALAVLTMIFASFFEVFNLSMLIPLFDRIFLGKEIIVPGRLPGFVQMIVDQVNAVPKDRVIYIVVVAFLIALIFKQIFTFAYRYLMGGIAQRIVRDIREQLYCNINALSLDYFSKKRTGELISRVTHDVPLVESAVSQSVTDLFRQGIMVCFYIGLAFYLYPQGALVVFLILPIIVIPMSKIGRRLRKLSKGSQERMADISSLLLETISGAQLVRAFQTQKYENDRFKVRNKDYYKLKLKTMLRLYMISPISEIFGGVLGTSMILLINHKLSAGEISLGVFISFFSCVLSTISPIKKLGNVNAAIQQALAANERIRDVLDEKPTVKESSDAVDLSELKGEIALSDVSFRYESEGNLVLDQINLTIRKGELVAFVGPTGTGKTTLINLIPRFYDASSGVVSFDGQNIKDVTFNSLRAQIGIVTQEAFLFNDTVRANITYGSEQEKQEQIEEAARKAFAHQFIKAMPKGYDTIVGDRGFRLSGGEKQRLAIARAILSNPPILILDEATSQLDAESEQYVQEALDKLMEGRTVLAIAHRLSTIKKADKIVVLEKGKIVGQGRHEELLTDCPLYKRLYEIQFRS